MTDGIVLEWGARKLSDSGFLHAEKVDAEIKLLWFVDQLLACGIVNLPQPLSRISKDFGVLKDAALEGT